MKYLQILFIAFAVLHCAFAPPVTPEKNEENKDDLAEYMEYHRYLNEVVQALESDPEFKSRLQSASEDEIRSGNVAHQLEFVNHNVRTKLDEIKRRELERLRHLTKKQHELTLADEQELNTLEGPSDEHVDHKNPHTFEIEDLKKLIKKVTTDLEKADKQRKEEFKEYEMQKEFEQHQNLETLNDKEKEEFQKKIEAEKEAKKHHQPLHHPGSKQQLEEVWEKQDHMDQQFDPKIFFMMHDVNSDGVWDADEVKALFIKELDKMYGPGGPNKDLHERAEEMERMREHVFYEVDRNRDGLIDFQEFTAETQKADFNQDQGWQPIDENQIYTKNEYAAYEQRRLEELRYLQSRGLVDAHGRPIPGLESQLHEARKQIPYGQYPVHHTGQVAPGQYYPQQGVPQGYQQQLPQQGVPQGHHQQVPQQAYQNVPQQPYQQVPQQPYQQVPQQAYQQVNQPGGSQGQQAAASQGIGVNQAQGQFNQQPQGAGQANQQSHNQVAQQGGAQAGSQGYQQNVPAGVPVPQGYGANAPGAPIAAAAQGYAGQPAQQAQAPPPGAAAAAPAHGQHPAAAQPVAVNPGSH